MFVVKILLTDIFSYYKLKHSERENMKSVKLFFLVFVSAILGGAISLGAFHFFIKDTMQVTMPGETDSRPATYQVKNITVPTFDFATVSELVTPTVVHIKITGNSRAGSQTDPFEFFGERFRYDVPPRQGSGSGVIISSDGYIVTNNHVIEGADKIDVVLYDKRSYVADVVGTDPSTDLALVKINATKLPAIEIGNSDDLKIGEWVLAVGNPFNLTSTVTAGIVSAKARNINILGGGSSIESFIQTDAAVNPGNSGGALVNTKGELIGINTAIASQTGSYAGYSFAVPVNIAQKVIRDITEYGTVQRGFIGVNIRTIDAELARQLDLERVGGIHVEGVNDNSAASEAGIKKGDVIIGVNDIVVNTVPELQEIIGRYRPGDKVDMTIWRNGSTKDYTLVLRNIEGTTELVTGKNQQVLAKIGADFAPAPEPDLKKLNLKNGVKVQSLENGKFKDIGIEEGFIITHINKKPVTKKSDVIKALQNEKGGVLIEGYNPNGTSGVYGLRIE